MVKKITINNKLADIEISEIYFEDIKQHNLKNIINQKIFTKNQKIEIYIPEKISKVKIISKNSLYNLDKIKFFTYFIFYVITALFGIADGSFIGKPREYQIEIKLPENNESAEILLNKKGNSIIFETTQKVNVLVESKLEEKNFKLYKITSLFIILAIGLFIFITINVIF